jgi:hypothetical protein
MKTGCENRMEAHLEPAAVGDDGPVALDELVQPPRMLDHLGPCNHTDVIEISAVLFHQ